MGYYSKAHSTEKLASTSISQILTQVTYPLYAEVQDDKVKLQSMVKRLTMTLSYLTFPLMFILLLCAKPIFVLLYSDRWLESVPYFQVLCIAGLAYCLQSVNLQTISAIGKSKTMFVWTLFKRIIGIGFVVGGLVIWGMKGLLVGMVLNTWFSYFVNIGLVSRHIGYKWWRQLCDIIPVMVVSALAALISYGCGYFLKFNLYPDGIVKFLIYVLIYLGWSFVFKPEAFLYFRTIINPFITRLHRRKKPI
jgi:O-antigen/teichoic acid export membrane protein